MRLLGDVDGITSIKTHLKGDFGFNGTLDLAFLFIEEILHEVQKGLDLFLALHLPRHWQYLQLLLIWYICSIISDASIIKQFTFFLDLFLDVFLNSPYFLP